MSVPTRTHWPTLLLQPRADPVVATGPEWEHLARLAKGLAWVTLVWLGVEAGIAIGAALVARSTALLGFGLDSGIEALASMAVVWRFSGSRLREPASEHRAHRLVAASYFLLAPYLAAEAVRSLVSAVRPEITVVGLVLTAATALFETPLGIAKRRIGTRLGSGATAGEGVQNLLCSSLAIAVFVSLLANALLGVWWLDGVVAIGIAAWALVEGGRSWQGRPCACVSAGCEDDAGGRRQQLQSPVRSSNR